VKEAGDLIDNIVYGFEKQRVLLVPHGGWHNDTICTVELKTHEEERVQW
jgi:hypothetical protein